MNVAPLNECKPHMQGCFVQGARLKDERVDRRLKRRYKDTSQLGHIIGTFRVRWWSVLVYVYQGTVCV